MFNIFCRFYPPPPFSHLLRVKGVPGELGDCLSVDLLPLTRHFLLNPLDPPENLLVRQSVERSSECVQTGGVAKVRIG